MTKSVHEMRLKSSRNQWAPCTHGGISGEALGMLDNFRRS